jgi:peptidoglycan/LPS O-acetylase OafA/YrhL
VAATAIENSTTVLCPQGFRGYIPELDFLRAFGITMVIIDHMWPPHHELSKVLNLSWILMDSFFVMSGFLIAGILLDSRSRPDYYRHFYTRRALRILPVYYLLITVLTFAAFTNGTGYLYSGIPTLYKWGSPWWFFVYLGSIPMAITGKAPTAARYGFAPLWSLQIEEQFYLLFPLLIKRLKLKTLALTLLSLICISPIVRIVLYRLYPSNTGIQYVFLPCRMEGLALGALIAVRFRMGPWDLSKTKLTVMAITSLAVTCLCGAWSGYNFTRPFNRTIGLLISPISFGFVVLWLVRFRGSRLTRCLRIAPVRYLAKISYSAYLFHIPLAGVLIPVCAAMGLGALTRGYLKVVTVFTLTVILSSLSWILFESPLMRLKERLTKKEYPPVEARALPLERLTSGVSGVGLSAMKHVSGNKTNGI